MHLVVPLSFDVGTHKNLKKVSIREGQDDSLGINKTILAIKSALMARRLEKELGGPVISFDTRNGLSFLFPRTGALRHLFIRGETKYQAKYNEPYLYGLFIRITDGLVKLRADSVVYNNLFSMRRDSSLLARSMPFITRISNDSNALAQCRFKRNNQDFTMGYCGQLSQRKNVEFLVQAFLLVREQFPATLIIKGNWEEHGWTKKYLDKNSYPDIAFSSWDGNVDDFYREIDLFVLPSLFDDFSNAAVDAITQGIPVLLSNTGGSPEMVENNGKLLFDLNDGQASLAERIEYAMINYQEMCREVGGLAAKYTFSWEEEVFAYLRFVHNAKESGLTGDKCKKGNDQPLIR